MGQPLLIYSLMCTPRSLRLYMADGVSSYSVEYLEILKSNGDF